MSVSCSERIEKPEKKLFDFSCAHFTALFVISQSTFARAGEDEERDRM